MKRYWGRLAWVALTNLPIGILSIYGLVDVHQRGIVDNASNPPPPSLWAILLDNYHLTLTLGLAGLGILFEALNRRGVGIINCGFWLIFFIYYIAQNSFPALLQIFYSPGKVDALYAFILACIVVIHCLWYAIPARQWSTKS